MANKIAKDYMSPMDRKYEEQQWHKDAASVTLFDTVEGRFNVSLPQRIRTGVENIELQLGDDNMQSKTGSSFYGKEAREDIKQIAKLSGVDIHTVHAPVSVQGLSGFDQRNNTFSEEWRERQVNEIAKTIDFVADTTKGSNLVVHLGEFPRSMAQHFPGEFEAFAGEEEKAKIIFSDRKTGGIQAISKDHIFPLFSYDEKRKDFKRDENGIPIIEEKTWQDFEKELAKDGELEFKRKYKLVDNWKDKKDKITPAIISSLIQTQEEKMQSELEMSNERMERINASLKHYEQQLKREPQNREVIELEKYRNEVELKALQRSVANMKQELQNIEKRYEDYVPVKEIALPRTSDTIARSAIMAMDIGSARKLERPIVIVPENINPTEYGSHPEELVEVVNSARQRFVDLLKKEKIEDPTGLFDKEGKIRKVENPLYRKGIDEKEAWKLAEKHIGATIDTMHMQRWMQHYKLKPGQTEPQREQEFYKWYQKEMGKLREKNVLGHIHVSDGFGRSLSHLPIGQGRLLDFSESRAAIDELRAMGLSITHEGWGEGPERQLTELWRAIDKPIYGLPSGELRFGDIHEKYLGGVQAPPYLFGELATEKEDFHLWSEVPLE